MQTTSSSVTRFRWQIRRLIPRTQRYQGCRAGVLAIAYEACLPDGEIQPAFANRLREMGSWLETYGESIYGTQGGPVKPSGWGATTRRGNLVYVHVLDPTLRVLALSDLDHPVGNAHLLNGGARVAYSFSQGSLVLDLPRRGARDIDQVIVLQLVNH